MKKLDVLNKNNFHKHEKREFDKNIIVGRWLVWKNKQMWAEFVFEISGRFVKIEQDKESVGNWLYLPNLQIINISFWDKSIIVFNFYIWYDIKNGSLMLKEYEQELDNHSLRLFLIEKGLFSMHYLQKVKEKPLSQFIEAYQTDIQVQNEIENNLINQKLGTGCSLFGLLMLFSLILGYGAILAWLILVVVYLFWGQSSMQKQLIEARLQNHFETHDALGLESVAHKTGSFQQKKFLYGLISFLIIAFVIFNTIR